MYLNEQKNISSTYLELPKVQRQAALRRQSFPPFTDHLLTVAGYKHPYKIRENRVLIRPYRPAGLTPGGIYLETNSKWPVMFGHVLAVPTVSAAQAGIRPGDMVHFKHLTDAWMHDEKPQTPRFIGETVECVILHIDSIKCVLHPAPVEFRL